MALLGHSLNTKYIKHTYTVTADNGNPLIRLNDATHACDYYQKIKIKRSKNRPGVYFSKFLSQKKSSTTLVWWLNLQLPVQSVFINTKVVSSNPVHGDSNRYNIM